MPRFSVQTTSPRIDLGMTPVKPSGIGLFTGAEPRETEWFGFRSSSYLGLPPVKWLGPDRYVASRLAIRPSLNH
jgi:hypothetical protein